jgi:hypothetical protein
MLLHQPVEDALCGVPLLGRRVPICPQHLIDQRPKRIQPRRPGRQRLARLGPDRGQRPLHSAKPTLCLLWMARMDSPARQSRWIAAYSSTLDLGCTSATSSRRARQCSHRKPRSSVTSQRHRLAAETIAVAGDRQTLSLVADRTTAGIRRTRRAGQMYMSSTSAGGRVRHVAGGDTSWGVAPAAPDRPRRPYPAEEASNLPACEAGQRSGRLVRRPTTACSPLASHTGAPGTTGGQRTSSRVRR